MTEPYYVHYVVKQSLFGTEYVTVYIQLPQPKQGICHPIHVGRMIHSSAGNGIAIPRGCFHEAFYPIARHD